VLAVYCSRGNHALSSRRIANCSLLIAHCSRSLLTAHRSLPIAYCPLLTAHCSLPIAHCSRSLLIAHCPLPIAHRSLLVAQCPSAFKTRLPSHSILISHHRQHRAMSSRCVIAQDNHTLNPHCIARCPPPTAHCSLPAHHQSFTPS
jgi:hypothetical protein